MRFWPANGHEKEVMGAIGTMEAESCWGHTSAKIPYVPGEVTLILKTVAVASLSISRM